MLVRLRCVGEACDWRETALAGAPSSGNAGRAFRVAGIAAIVAALAVTTLVFLTGDDATASLAAKLATAAPVAAARAAINEEGVISWVIGVREQVEMNLLERTN